MERGSCGRHDQWHGLRMRQVGLILLVHRLVQSSVCCKLKFLHDLMIGLVFWFLGRRWTRGLLKVWSFLDDINWDFMSRLIWIGSFTIGKFRLWMNIPWNFSQAFNSLTNAALWLFIIVILLLLFHLLYLIHPRVRCLPLTRTVTVVWSPICL